MMPDSINNRLNDAYIIVRSEALLACCANIYLYIYIIYYYVSFLSWIIGNRKLLMMTKKAYILKLILLGGPCCSVNSCTNDKRQSLTS